MDLYRKSMRNHDVNAWEDWHIFSSFMSVGLIVLYSYWLHPVCVCVVGRHALTPEEYPVHCVRTLDVICIKNQIWFLFNIRINTGTQSWTTCQKSHKLHILYVDYSQGKEDVPHYLMVHIHSCSFAFCVLLRIAVDEYSIKMIHTFPGFI